MKALYSTDAFTQLGTKALIRFSRELRRQCCGHCLPGCDETAAPKHNVPDKTTTRTHTIVSRPFGLRDSCGCVWDSSRETPKNKFQKLIRCCSMEKHPLFSGTDRGRKSHLREREQTRSFTATMAVRVRQPWGSVSFTVIQFSDVVSSSRKVSSQSQHNVSFPKFPKIDPLHRILSLRKTNSHLLVVVLGWWAVVSIVYTAVVTH